MKWLRWLVVPRYSICGYVENGLVHLKTLGNQGKPRFEAVARVLPDSIRELL